MIIYGKFFIACHWKSVITAICNENVQLCVFFYWHMKDTTRNHLFFGRYCDTVTLITITAAMFYSNIKSWKYRFLLFFFGISFDILANTVCTFICFSHAVVTARMSVSLSVCWFITLDWNISTTVGWIGTDICLTALSRLQSAARIGVNNYMMIQSVAHNSWNIQNSHILRQKMAE